MNSRCLFRGHLILAAIAVMGMAVAPRHAAAQTPYADVQYVPASSAPPLPPGLKVICLEDPDKLGSSATCPVVKYQGITTWAYSYIDNRVSLALVSYDKSDKVVANVEKPGVRYVFDALSSLHTKTVIFFGQSKQFTTATWTQLGPR